LVLPGPMTFVVRPLKISAPGEAFAAPAKIEIDARIPAVKRRFDRFRDACPEALQAFGVRFPLQLSPVRCLYSMAPGESARLEFCVFNASRKHFGAKGEIARAIGWRLHLESSQVGAAHVELVEPTTAGQSLSEGIEGAIPRLGDGQRQTISGTLRLSADAPVYEAVRLRASLRLGRIQSPDDLVDIHLRDFVVRVAQRYVPDRSAQALLVVHNRTTREELDAWQVVAASLGLRVAVWDVALEGHCDFDADVAGGTLREQFAGKPIILLNDLFDTHEGPQHVHAMLAPDALLRHACSGGTTVVVGGQELPLHHSLIPAARARSALARPGTSRRQDLATLLTGSAVLEDALVLAFNEKKLFGLPNEADLLAIAGDVARSAEAAAPERRYVAIHDFDLALQGDGFVKQWSLGTVTLERTLDVAERGVAAVKSSDEELRDPERVLGVIAPLSFAIGLPGAARVAVLRGAADRVSPVASGQRGAATADDTTAPDAPVGFVAAESPRPFDWLRRTFAVDVARSVTTAMKRPRLAARGEGADPAFPELAQLRASLRDADAVDPRSLFGAVVIESIAVARCVAWGQISWWMFLPPLFVFFVWWRAMVIHLRVRSSTAAVFDAAFPDGPGEATARREVARERLKEARRCIMRSAWKIPRFVGSSITGESITAWLEERLEQAGLRLPTERSSLVLSAAERMALDDARNQQYRRAQRVVAAMAHDRASRSTTTTASAARFPLAAEAQPSIS